MEESGGWEQLYYGFGRLRLCDIGSQPVGDTHQVRQGLSLHLAHELGAMDLDRDFAELKFCGDLLVQLTSGNKRHDLALARCQRVEALPQFCENCRLCSAAAVDLDASMNCVEQILIA